MMRRAYVGFGAGKIQLPHPWLMTSHGFVAEDVRGGDAPAVTAHKTATSRTLAAEPVIAIGIRPTIHAAIWEVGHEGVTVTLPRTC